VSYSSDDRERYEQSACAKFTTLCRICGSGEKAWHHNPVIGGSALDHGFEPSSSAIEALLAIGRGRPFVSVTLCDFDFYTLVSYARSARDAEAEQPVKGDES